MPFLKNLDVSKLIKTVAGQVNTMAGQVQTEQQIYDKAKGKKTGNNSKSSNVSTAKNTKGSMPKTNTIRNNTNTQKPGGFFGNRKG